MPATQTITIHMTDGTKSESESVHGAESMQDVAEMARKLLLALGYTGRFYQVDVSRSNGDFYLAPVMQDGRWLDDLEESPFGDALYHARNEWAYGSRPDAEDEGDGERWTPESIQRYLDMVAGAEPTAHEVARAVPGAFA